MILGQHKLDLVFLSFFLLLLFWGGTKVGGWTLEDEEVNVIGIHYVEFLNNQ